MAGDPGILATWPGSLAGIRGPGTGAWIIGRIMAGIDAVAKSQKIRPVRIEWHPHPMK